MQLTTILSAAAAMAATASADATAKQLMADFIPSKPYTRIVNRCNYPVNLWSIRRGMGCDNTGMVTLKKGEVYQENMQEGTPSGQGVSIKISKTDQCKGNDITQLEYFICLDPTKVIGNFLDVSYVDCQGGDCPTMNEGFYLKAGSQSGKPGLDGQATTSSAGNTICPILSCHDRASCSKVGYVLPDDEQTRMCGKDQNLEFYMCGSEAPSDNDSYDSKPAYSAPSAPKPSPSKPASSSAANNYKVNAAAAAVTNAPEIKEVPKTPKVKTNVVYVTEYKYVDAKRHEHAHAHARRHQILRA